MIAPALITAGILAGLYFTRPDSSEKKEKSGIPSISDDDILLAQYDAVREQIKRGDYSDLTPGMLHFLAVGLRKSGRTKEADEVEGYVTRFPGLPPPPPVLAPVDFPQWGSPEAGLVDEAIQVTKRIAAGGTHDQATIQDLASRLTAAGRTSEASAMIGVLYYLAAVAAARAPAAKKV